MLSGLTVVMEEPGRLGTRRLPLDPPQASDIVVEIRWSGISTGTERLLFDGPHAGFPGMGYPLVPGYESVGEVVEAGPDVGRAVGETVFVPGAPVFRAGARPVRRRGLAARGHGRARHADLDARLGERGVLLALAATAYHASRAPRRAEADLIVGHGVLGRLLARLACCRRRAPVVWETNPERARRRRRLPGDRSRTTDTRRDYRTICDVSGDARCSTR